LLIEFFIGICCASWTGTLLPSFSRIIPCSITSTAELQQYAVIPAPRLESQCMQVVAILEAGHPLPFTVKAANLDLPELQGEPTQIAKEKCRLAAQQV
jgi:hypothetical protein